MKSLPNKLTSSLCGYLEAYLCLWMGAEVFIKDGVYQWNERQFQLILGEIMLVMKNNQPIKQWILYLYLTIFIYRVPLVHLVRLAHQVLLERE